MRYAIRWSLPLLAALLAAAPARALDWQSWNAGLRAARATGRPVLVDVYTDWCGWCKRMDRDVYSRSDIDGYLHSHFVIVRLNAESMEAESWRGHSYSARALASTFEVSGYPTTIFFTSEGERLVNLPGYVEPDRFLLLLRYIGDGHLARNEPWDDYVKSAQGGEH